MYRTIPFRRHQDWKHKRKAKQILKEWEGLIQYDNPFYGGKGFRSFLKRYKKPTEDERLVGKIATTPTRASQKCSINVRQFGGVSRQEINHVRNTLDELEDLGYNTKRLKKLSTRYEDIWNF